MDDHGAYEPATEDESDESIPNRDTTAAAQWHECEGNTRAGECNGHDEHEAVSNS